MIIFSYVGENKMDDVTFFPTKNNWGDLWVRKPPQEFSPHPKIVFSGL